MKPHIIIKLVPTAVPGHTIPSWIDVVQQDVPATDTLMPAVDSLFTRHRIPVQVTREFRPAANNRWNDSEQMAGFDRTYRLILRENRDIPTDLVHSIRLLPEVEEARIGTTAVVELPTASQLGIRRRQPGQLAREQILLEEAHQLSKGHERIIIAVLDTGVDTDHPELAHALLPGKDFVNILDGLEDFVGDILDVDTDPADEWVGHGTHVAGIIAGKGLNMPAGVAPDCKILPVRVLGALREGDRFVGAGLVDNINHGIKWAVDQGAHIINMSLGVPHTDGPKPYEDAIAYAKSHGVTVIAASGNNGRADTFYPSGLEYVITVGAIDENDAVAAFSTYGPHVDLVAPGSEIYSSHLDAKYAFSTGTSQAAPFATGVVGLLKALALTRKKRLRDRHVKYVLKHSTDKVGTKFFDPKSGYGRLNARDALRLLSHKLN